MDVLIIAVRTRLWSFGCSRMLVATVIVRKHFPKFLGAREHFLLPSLHSGLHPRTNHTCSDYRVWAKIILLRQVIKDVWLGLVFRHPEELAS